MAWFYVDENSILGPVSPAEFGRLVGAGVITPATMVWQAGQDTWKPWGEVQPPTLGSATWEAVAQRDREVRIDEVWPAAWNWFLREPRKLIGLVAILTLIVSVLYLVGLALSLVLPVAQSLLGALVVGPLSTGGGLMLLERWRGGELTLATARRGFGPRYWPLVTGLLIQQLVLGVAAVIALVGLAPMMVVAYLVRQDPEAVPPGVALVTLLLGGGVGMVGVLVYFYFTVAWLFAPLLMLDKGLKFWPAMQLSQRVTNRHPWSFSWFLLVASTLALAGVLLLGIGLFVTLPLGGMMLVIAYEHLFGDLVST